MSWWRTAERVDALAERELGTVVGVYVHGSAALGGRLPHSDVDVLVVVPDLVRGQGPSPEHLLAFAGPLRHLAGPPLELSVIEESLARRPVPPWRYLLHLAAPRVVLGTTAEPSSRPEDGDLPLHLAVTRAGGITVRGPAASDLIGQVAPDLIRRHLVEELEWGLLRGGEQYVVENACRAAAWHQEGLFLSKQDGATWARFRLPRHTALIGRILDERQAAVTEAGFVPDRHRPPGIQAHRLVADVIRLLSGVPDPGLVVRL